MNIVEETQALIRDSGMTLSEICSKSNVSVRWMQNFIHGKMKDPGALRVERIRQILSSKEEQAA